jgi:hypothetical protein
MLKIIMFLLMFYKEIYIAEVMVYTKSTMVSDYPCVFA